jgi:glycosyltransferase involved in cell wall biosynthesis
MGLSDHITFFPFTDKPNFVFERIDITVLSSLYKEGLPNVLLESMAMGVPVVSTDLGGVAEIVLDGKTGFKVAVDDSSGLAQAIEKVWVEQDDYQQMGENARTLINENFDKRLQFDRFLEYFTHIKAQYE